jgi:hypothetical protein
MHLKLNPYHITMQAVEDGACSVRPNVEASQIKIPPWTVQVVGWGDEDDCELLDIPRGKSSTCLPLPEDVNYVSFRLRIGFQCSKRKYNNKLTLVAHNMFVL